MDYKLLNINLKRPLNVLTKIIDLCYSLFSVVIFTRFVYDSLRFRSNCPIGLFTPLIRIDLITILYTYKCT